MADLPLDDRVAVHAGDFPQLIALALYTSLIVIWIVVIRVQRRQVEHMAQQARTVLAREDPDLLG